MTYRSNFSKFVLDHLNTGFHLLVIISKLESLIHENIILHSFEFIVLDDMERDMRQNTLLVGSLNNANKYTIGRGKMQKLSGIIITKNIDPDRQKMPTKVPIF